MLEPLSIILPNHRVLVSDQVTKHEKLRGFLEANRITDHALAIGAVAISIFCSATVVAMGRGKPHAIRWLRLSLVAAACVVASIYSSKQRIERMKASESMTDLHVAVMEKKYYWLKCALQNPQINVLQQECNGGASALYLAVAKNNRISTALLLRNDEIKAHINDRCLPIDQRKEPTDPIAKTSFRNQKMQETAKRIELEKVGGNYAKSALAPLQAAITNNSIKMVKLLLENGADSRIEDSANNNTVKFAESLPTPALEGSVAEKAAIIAVLKEDLPKWALVK